MKTYFYIIHRDGQIFEIEYTADRFDSAMEQWQKGGLIILPSLGAGINCADVTKILNADQYNSYIDSVRPTMYIKNGSWYEINDRRKPIRHETWKQKAIDETLKLKGETEGFASSNKFKYETVEKNGKIVMKEIPL